MSGSPQPSRGADDDAALTRTELADLQKVARLNARVARTGIDALKAQRLSDLEAELSAIYRADDERWAALVEVAREAADEADRKLALICERDGIPTNNRPSISVDFYGRGEYGLRERRIEVRKAASAELDARAKAAKLAVGAKEASVLTRLLARGLRSVEARALLESMPSPEALLPPVDARELPKLRLALKAPTPQLVALTPSVDDDLDDEADD